MKITRLLLLLAALATGASAQQDPAKLALAREVIAAMHADRMFDGIAAQMKQMFSSATAVPQTATPEQRKKLEDLQGRIMDLSMNSAKGLIAQMDRIYADVYSLAELTAMKAFFTSPEGQSMLAKQPQIMKRLMPMVQEMQRDLGPKVQKLIDESRAAK